MAIQPLHLIKVFEGSEGTFLQKEPSAECEAEPHDLCVPAPRIPDPLNTGAGARKRERQAAGGLPPEASGVRTLSTATKLFPEFPLFNGYIPNFTCSKFLKVLRKLFSKSFLSGV